jgi:replicative DNA helicase
MIYSLELEKQLLSGLIKHPEVYVEISPFIGEDDFYDKNTSVNKTVFCVLKNAIENAEKVDHVTLAERIATLNLTFPDNINIGQYVQALDLRKAPKDTVLTTAKDLKQFTVRRELCLTAAEVQRKMKNASSGEDFLALVNSADVLWNDNINLYDSASNMPENLFAGMEDIVEDRGNNPVEEFGLVGPHKRLHQLYGSLLRPGNITTITARSGVGKTQFTIDFCLEASKLNGDAPVLHLDNGEMSREELLGRLCSRESGVPLHLIETGKWRNAGNAIVERVRSVWAKVKNYKFYYYNVAGTNVDQMINLVKRFYYSKVGRGNSMILNFDYIKTTSENLKNKQEWQVVGEMVDKFKTLVQKDVVFNNEPMIAMMTSVQSNRTGITQNRNANNIVEDESIVSLSDRITQFSSHLFSLRQRSNDEMVEHPDFGTHKLVCLKHRHLGSEYLRALQPVKMDDGSLSKNAIFLNFENFHITEVGDLQDLVDGNIAEANLNSNNELNEVPNI